MTPTWTGPLPDDLLPGTLDVLCEPVPPERWPYCLPSEHMAGCHLHDGGCYCDCDASAIDEGDDG